MKVFNLNDSRIGKLTYDGDVKEKMREKRDFSVGDIKFYFETPEAGCYKKLYLQADCLPCIIGIKNISCTGKYIVNNPLQVITAAICKKAVLVSLGENPNDQVSLWVNFEEEIKFFS